MNISRELKQDFEKYSQLKYIFREISDSGVVTFQYELLFFALWMIQNCLSFKLWKKLLLLFYAK